MRATAGTLMVAGMMLATLLWLVNGRVADWDMVPLVLFWTGFIGAVTSGTERRGKR